MNAYAPNDLSLDAATDEHYAAVIEKLELARAQLASENRGEAQRECAVCGDTDHTAKSCQRNPLLHMVIGVDAIAGTVYRCFHCEAVFTDRASAEQHFGISIDALPACLETAP